MLKRVIIGVTGALATGKTTVSDMFVRKGAVKIDADEIAHKLLDEDDALIREVVGIFGKGICTGGKIDRRKIARRVFFDDKSLAAFCRILHPKVIQHIKRIVSGLGEKTIIIDAPLLIETGLYDYVDLVVVVKTNTRVQSSRCKKRLLSGKMARGIIAAQMPLSQKKEFADFIIDNNKDVGTTKKGVDRIWEKIKKNLI